MKAKVKIDGVWYNCQSVEFLRDDKGAVKLILVEAKTGPNHKWKTGSDIHEVVLE